MNKIAIVHLFCNGFEGEELLDFTLQLSNPSTIAQQQKLELYRSRFEIAQSALGIEGLVTRDWIRKTIFSMTDDEIENIERERVEDKKNDLEIEAVRIPGEAGDELGSTLGAGIGVPGGGEDTGPGAPEPESPVEIASDDRNTYSLPVLTSDDSSLKHLSISDDDAPIKAQNQVNRDVLSVLKENIDIDEDEDDDEDLTDAEKEVYWNAPRRKTRSSDATPVDHSHSRDDVSDSIFHPFGRKLSKRKSNSDLNDLKNPLRNSHKIQKLSETSPEQKVEIDSFLDNKVEYHARLTKRLKATLESIDRNPDLNIENEIIDIDFDDI